MSLTFAPGVNPEFPFGLEPIWNVDEIPAIKPYVARVPRGLREISTASLVYPALTRRQKEYILSFFRELRGPASDFLWTPPDAVDGPLHRGPDLDQVTLAGAPGSSRNYIVKFTWYDPATGQETEASPVSTITVTSGKVLVITVPVFPLGVSAFRVYAGTVLDSEWTQGYSTLRTWTEPVTGLLTTTSLAPGANNLKPAMKWAFLRMSKPQKVTSNRWRMQLDFLQLHA